MLAVVIASSRTSLHDVRKPKTARQARTNFSLPRRDDEYSAFAERETNYGH
jgi:hypothetical protein